MSQVTLTLAEQKIPGMFEKRLKEANAAGVQLHVEHTATHAEARLRAFNDGETTSDTVKHNDQRGILDRLADIAAGRVRVV